MSNTPTPIDQMSLCKMFFDMGRLTAQRELENQSKPEGNGND